MFFWNCAKSLKRYACAVGCSKNTYKLEVPKRRPAECAGLVGKDLFGSDYMDLTDLNGLHARLFESRLPAPAERRDARY